MDKHHYVLFGLGALALFYVYKKKNPSTAAGTVDYTTQQSAASSQWWNFGGLWQTASA